METSQSVASKSPTPDVDEQPTESNRSYKKKLYKMTRENERLQSELSEAKDIISKWQKREDELSELEDKHTEEMESLQKRHDKEMEKLDKKHEREFEKMEIRHEEEETELEERQDRETDKIVSAYGLESDDE
jgi:chromosome segregation ATPase